MYVPRPCGRDAHTHSRRDGGATGWAKFAAESPSLRSGFRQRAQTPAKRLNLDLRSGLAVRAFCDPKADIAQSSAISASGRFAS
jgi:hypothetical protein